MKSLFVSLEPWTPRTLYPILFCFLFLFALCSMLYALCAMLYSLCPSYLNFSVLRAIRAKKMVMIQKRTITLGSAHPFSSK